VSNLHNKFKRADSYNQLRNAAEQSQQERKQRLALGVERQLVSFLSRKFGHVKVLEPSILTEYEGKEDPESGALLFSGKVKSTVELFDSHGLKTVSFLLPVESDQFAIDEETILKTIEEAEMKTRSLPESPKASSVLEVDISKFNLQDDGTEYLKIYHPDVYATTPIATISKRELEEKKGDNIEGILKEAVTNESSDWGCDISFIGKFAMPEVKTLEREVIKEKDGKEIGKEIIRQTETVQVENISESESPDSTVEKSPSPTVEPLLTDLSARMEDTFRFLTESEQLKESAAHRKFVDKVVHDFVMHIQTNKVGSCTVKKVSSDLKEGEKGFEGKIEIRAEIFSKDGLKVVPIVLPVKSGAVEFPEVEVILKTIEEAEKHEVFQEVDKEIKEELNQALNKIETDEQEKEKQLVESLSEKNDSKKVKKVAEMSGQFQHNRYHPTIRISKDMFVHDLPVGAVVQFDGYKYKLVSKDENSNSKEAGQASYWVFQLCDQEEDADLVQRAY